MVRYQQRERHREPLRPNKSRRLTPVRAGVAAVEFAIVAPVFFMLILGIIEIGRAMMVQQVLVNASRVGARQAALLTSTQSGVESAVTDYANGVGIHGVQVTVSTNPATATAGTAITVGASTSFSNVSWLRSPWIMGGKTLSATSTMRKEGF
jgi:Flp pilus assembly protein TadG